MTLLDLGRVLLASYFVGSGLRHFFVFDAVSGAIAGRGLPFPRVVLAAGTATFANFHHPFGRSRATAPALTTPQPSSFISRWHSEEPGK